MTGVIWPGTRLIVDQGIRFRVEQVRNVGLYNDSIVINLRLEGDNREFFDALLTYNGNLAELKTFAVAETDVETWTVQEIFNLN